MCGVFYAVFSEKGMIFIPYAIMRFAKKKSGGVGSCCAHNERRKEIYKSNPDIVPERRNDNYHLIRPAQSYQREVKRLIKTAGCRVRKDSTVMVETLITASPEFMQKLKPQEQREYFERALSFIQSKISKEKIISAVVHMDEKTPHMHLAFCPITSDNRLSAKDILGNQAKLSKWQTEYHKAMSERWSELERGISAQLTKRKHIPVWLFKTAERLDKQFKNVEYALLNINAVNARKQREKALDLLAAWLPEAEKFTAQLKTITGYVNQIKAETSYQKQRNDDIQQTLLSERSERKGEQFEHHVRVKNLEAKLKQQNKLLKQITPEVLEQIKKNQRTKGLER